MKPTFTGTIVLSVVCGVLCSCNTSRQRVDYTWFKDTVTAPQDDVVTVEAGSGMTAAEAAAPVTTPPVAAAQPPAPAVPAATTPDPLPPVTAPPAPAAPIAATTPAKATTNRWWWPFGQGQQAPADGSPAASTVPATYTVKQGDTLSVIARRHGVSMAALAQANALTNPNALRIGQVLTIPGGTAAPTAAPITPAAQPAAAPAAPPAPVTAGQYYTVRKGDTLSAIARRHNTSMAKIMQLNNMTAAQAQRLSIGQRIILPAR
ncbi:MAG: LysM peptidoglycan-binding domain-containing protein [Akkermansia sp.]|nr:LysM peptidoglycan-binding domain-containing protein [Akkermansia sp.]